MSFIDEVSTIRIRADLNEQGYEHCRKVLKSIEHMISADNPRARDAFYQESMRHLAQLEQMLGDWRCRVSMLGPISSNSRPVPDLTAGHGVDATRRFAQTVSAVPRP